MAIITRAAKQEDVPFLVECNAAMARETEHKTLDREVLTRGTRAVFDDPRRGFYLIAEVERRARAAGAVGLRLYVERDNAHALRTYFSLGMEEEPYRMLRKGFIEFR